MLLSALAASPETRAWLCTLTTPSIDASKAGGRVGLKAEGFAGAEAGGALSGAVEWLPPAEFGKGSGNPGSLTSGNSGWSALAQIKAEGNLAIGIGAEADFGISMTNNEFAIHCKANLVFGPGAGGGFGTVVDLQKSWELIMLVCETLSSVDYRYLLGIETEAFNSISRILYKAALAPGKTAEEIMGNTVSGLNRWWLTREAGIAEAAQLTRGILANKSVNLGGRVVPIDKLPPETLGPILWVLTESYIGESNPAQEKAIVEVLSRVRRWRHLIETLEHMSESASRVNALDSLNRLNSFLVDKQQDDFNRYLDGLALHGAPTTPPMQYAWDVHDSMIYGQKKAILLASASRQTNTRQA